MHDAMLQVIKDVWWRLDSANVDDQVMVPPPCSSGVMSHLIRADG